MNTVTAIKKDIYTVGEVCELLGVHRTTMSVWIRNGLIVKIPGTHKITRAEYERFIGYQAEPKDRRRGRYNVGQRNTAERGQVKSA